MSADSPTPDHEDPTAPARVRYQSFVDPREQQPYMPRLQERLATYAAPHVPFDMHGTSPPDRHLSPLKELRCAGQVIREFLANNQ